MNNLCDGVYNLTVTDSNNCMKPSSVIITEPNALSLTMSPDDTICNGGIPSNLSANSGVVGNYAWSPSTNLSSANVQNPSFSTGLISSETYIVSFTHISGCTVTDSVRILVNPLPTVTISALPSPACVGDTITLTATTSIPVSKYRFQYNTGPSWQNLTAGIGNGFINTNPNSNTIFSTSFPSILTTTQFRVKVRENWGCTPSAWSPTITVPISIVATSPIYHN